MVFPKPGRRVLQCLILVICVLLAANGALSPAYGEEISWPEILKKARGQTVDWYMWGGFPTANAYVNGFVAPRVAELYGIRLRQVPVKDIFEIVSKVLVEKTGRKARRRQSGPDVDQWRKFPDLQTKRTSQRALCPWPAQRKIGELGKTVGLQ